VNPVWGLLAVGLLFAFLGLAFAAEPGEGRDFFSRMHRQVFGEGVRNRFDDRPEVVFRALGVVFMFGGALMALASLGFL
jgi:hypothetical protein